MQYFEPSTNLHECFLYHHRKMVHMSAGVLLVHGPEGKNLYWLSERRAILGITGAQLRASLILIVL